MTISAFSKLLIKMRKLASHSRKMQPSIRRITTIFHFYFIASWTCCLSIPMGSVWSRRQQLLRSWWASRWSLHLRFLLCPFARWPQAKSRLYRQRRWGLRCYRQLRLNHSYLVKWTYHQLKFNRKYTCCVARNLYNLNFLIHLVTLILINRENDGGYF